MTENFIEVRRKSPRFQLIKKEIDRLSPEGIYRFIANDKPGKNSIMYEATRAQLEATFARAMLTDSYLKKGRFHQHPWELAEQFRL